MSEYIMTTYLKKRFDIKVVRIFDKYGYIITHLTTKRVWTSETVFKDEIDAKKAAITKAYSI
jgi:hypothetical protein